MAEVDRFQWLQAILKEAELEAHIEKARAWVEATGCKLSDLLTDEEAVADISEALALRKYEDKRFKRVLGRAARTSREQAPQIDARRPPPLQDEEDNEKPAVLTPSPSRRQTPKRSLASCPGSISFSPIGEEAQSPSTGPPSTGLPPDKNQAFEEHNDVVSEASVSHQAAAVRASFSEDGRTTLTCKNTFFDIPQSPKVAPRPASCPPLTSTWWSSAAPYVEASSKRGSISSETSSRRPSVEYNPRLITEIGPTPDCFGPGMWHRSLADAVVQATGSHHFERLLEAAAAETDETPRHSTSSQQKRFSGSKSYLGVGDIVATPDWFGPTPPYLAQHIVAPGHLFARLLQDATGAPSALSQLSQASQLSTAPCVPLASQLHVTHATLSQGSFSPGGKTVLTLASALGFHQPHAADAAAGNACSPTSTKRKNKRGSKLYKAPDRLDDDPMDGMPTAAFIDLGCLVKLAA